MRPLILALAALLLAACAPRPGPETLAPVDAVAEATTVRLYVATNRAPLAPPATGFGGGISTAVSYRYYDISVPPEPRNETIYWRHGTPDPQHDFLVTASGSLSRREFLADVARDNTRGPNPEVTVFVHGYNYSFAEAVLSLAKLTAETGTGMAPVLFSWPSNGHALDYVADRQEALASRDALAGLVEDLTPLPGQLLLAAHSMGGWLAMEGLRTIALEGHRQVLDDLDLVLIAPDIDLAVFRQQLEVVGPLRQPVAIMVSKDDRALGLSSRISTNRPRLGAVDVDDPEVQAAAQAADVQLIDISRVPAVTAMRHDRYLQMGAFYRAFTDKSSGLDLFRQAGAFAFDTLGTGLIQVGATLGAN